MKRRSLFVAFAWRWLTAITVGVQAAGSDSTQTLTAAQISLFTTAGREHDRGRGGRPGHRSAAGAPRGQAGRVRPGALAPRAGRMVRCRGLSERSKLLALSGHEGSSHVQRSGCPTSDPKDNENDGLVLDKMGPTDNNAIAFAEIKGVKGPITELGYDIRKWSGTRFSPNGSHCGAGAPRFDVYTTDGLFFVGCQSPPPTTEDDAARRGSGCAGGRLAGVVGYSASTGLPRTDHR